MDSQPNIASLCGITTVRATDAQRNATCTAPDEERASRCDLTSWYASLERDAIIALAHRYWRERGCPEGSAEEDWFRAERDLRTMIHSGYLPDYFEVGVVLRLPH